MLDKGMPLFLDNCLIHGIFPRHNCDLLELLMYRCSIAVPRSRRAGMRLLRKLQGALSL